MTRSHAFFSSSTTSCPSSSVTMGKVCFLFNVLLMLTCMAPHRMTKAHPLACDCKPGWPLFSFTHPLACTCEPGWVSSFQREPTHATQDDESPPPCMRLQAGVAVVLTYPTPTPSTCNTSPNDPSTCNTSHNDPQRVITTCWGLSLPLHLQCQPQRPPTSHYDSLGALSPPPPATPASSTPFSRRRPFL